MPRWSPWRRQASGLVRSISAQTVYPPLSSSPRRNRARCALGATLWSGVTRLVCGARAEDAEAIGFDEGPKLPDWAAQLEARGIEVIRDVERGYAAAVLQEYAAGGGPVYNGRGGF